MVNYGISKDVVNRKKKKNFSFFLTLTDWRVGMGNFFSFLFRAVGITDNAEQPSSTPQRQPFSWYNWVLYLFLWNENLFGREREDRKAIKKEDFILDKLKDQTIYRLPGSVNGQQFISMIKIFNLFTKFFVFFSSKLWCKY